MCRSYPLFKVSSLVSLTTESPHFTSDRLPIGSMYAVAAATCCGITRWASRADVWEIPTSCPAHTHTHTHTHTNTVACLRSLKHTPSLSLSLYSPSVSLCHSVVLFLDRLPWHCCGFSCPAFRTEQPTSTAHRSADVCVCVCVSHRKWSED